ncbi:PspA/IM30 family protein [Limnoraphis robusta]|uniref:PspA/IM30 family protein n=2 Tax=Limnoraphis TaxID=1332112 RepID=A0ABU5U5X2_9CYAN|nr:PspA/IM30 family protein [Limnoraphis robusta]MEA5496505.1 PspA/IM30 family protein [Limnoraphis robusta BA-68 BA1]MEA5522529.1 PspA/IM30 family protein [Limnoraphis robusta CCNP1315]MEA5548272.1 PspA/IM30 family protein [Limnoraphis robusta CCNP1324]
MRVAVKQAVLAQQQTQQQYEQYKSEVDKWYSRVQLALQKGDENLAREALLRKQYYEEQAKKTKVILDNHRIQVERLKRNLSQCEGKIYEPEIKKYQPVQPKIEEKEDSTKLLEKAIQETRLAMNHAIKSKEYLQKQLSEQDSMILQLKQHLITLESLKTQLKENVSEKANNTSIQKGTSLEECFFAQLEDGSDYDDLEALKTQMLGSAKTQGQLPVGEETTTAPQTPAQKTEVDSELEKLREQLDNL